MFDTIEYFLNKKKLLKANLEEVSQTTVHVTNYA